MQVGFSPSYNRFRLFVAIFCSGVICLVGGCASVHGVRGVKGGHFQRSFSLAFGLYEVSSFDVYVENDTIHVLVAGKGNAQDKKAQVRYTRSEDGGQTWLESVSLAGLPTTIASRGNDVQLAAKDGHLAAIWQTSGELPGMGALVSGYSDDNGLTWMRGANPAENNAGDQSHSDIIADQNGSFHAVWLEDPEENGYQSVRYARSEDGGKRWDKPMTLDDSTCSCCWNTLALTPENGLSILYRDMKPRDMGLLQSSDGGRSWSRIGVVGDFGWQFDGCPHVGGSLVSGGNSHPGGLYSLVWTGLDQKAGLYFLKSQDNGKTWALPIRIGNTAVHGDLAVNRTKISAIWDEMEAKGNSIFFGQADFGANVAFTPVRLTQADVAATHPKLAATKHGLLALWTEKPKKQLSRLVLRVIE